MRKYSLFIFCLSLLFIIHYSPSTPDKQVFMLRDGREFLIRNKLDTNVSCWMKAENVEEERHSTPKYF